MSITKYTGLLFFARVDKSVLPLQVIFYFAFEKGLLKGQIWECMSKNPKVSYVLQRMGTLLISKEQINIPISDAETKRSPCIATFHL